MRLGSCDGDGLRALLAVRAGQGRWTWKRPSHSGGAQERFTLFAESWFIKQGGAASLIVQQNGFDYGFQVAANACPIVVESLDNAVKVIAARMTRDESLN